MLCLGSPAVIVRAAHYVKSGTFTQQESVVEEVRFSIDSNTGALKLGSKDIPAKEVNADVILQRLCEYNFLDSKHTGFHPASMLFAP